VREVVRDVVADIAPDELPLVDGLSSFDDDRAIRLLIRRGSGRRDPLGFGLDEIVVLASPVVWVVVNEAAKRAASKAVDGAAKGARSGLRKLFRRNRAARVVPPLSREQLAEVRRQVLELAAHNGFDEQRAQALADGVVARLTLELPREDGYPSN
jgi:hypothetical protein